MAIKTFFDATDTNDTRELRFIPADPANARTLTREQIEHYNENGFISGLPAFDSAEITRIRSYLDDLLEKVLSAQDRRNSYSINAYHMVCAGIYDMLLQPVLLDYVQDILGTNFGCWGNHLFCKLPGDPMQVPLHQDGAYWPISPSRTVTVWLAVDEADEENAAMQFVPGSHLRGAIDHEDLPLDGTRVLKRQAVGPGSLGERFTNALAAGEVSLHSDLLLHGSERNDSNSRRAGMTFRYAAAEVAPLRGSEYWFAPCVHCRGDLPAHWPHRRRPDGEHPEKMAEFFGDFDGLPLPNAG
ncbi:MAG: phytanoyl-CoA dioxygenase family protein [Candidatus Binatia bacterium]|nr:phytanoyl-CoA dioxygenase family protein [Candidatus Binatia bacterium]